MKKITDLYERFDADKWAHPEVRESWALLASAFDGEPVANIYDFDKTREERLAAVHEKMKMVEAYMSTGDNKAIVRRELRQAPGCPEEPETGVELVVYRPEGAKQGEKLPVLFVSAGGGLYACMIEIDGASDYPGMADRFGAVVVAPRYRTAFEGRYPAAINDLHAGYQYVVDNADDLGVDADNIVIYGLSSGSFLALSLAHRLKRYGYRPKGCVVESALVDNRPIYASSSIVNRNWDGRAQWLSSIEYLGPDNVSSFNTPEMYPNYATEEECIGLCPTFIHTDAEESDASSSRAYMDKLSRAGVYHELHDWGGSMHSGVSYSAVLGLDGDYYRRYRGVIDGNIRDCFKYDLRRQWIVDED